MLVKKLLLQFKNEKNTINTLVLKDVLEPIDPAKVQAAMNVIAQSNIFVDKNGKKKYVTPLAAKVVNTEDNSVFDLRQK
ncbi:DUF2922 domain-containing protein [Periweissella fabalis]|uniref:DUF2922 domain-containing protein n=1 Tax=Periweissella fabalis TaxID=1070421 RepID=A0A7X6N4N2_9LACO|nr:DUF2922 domain-containing protein [Periweissella fabalis]MCM0598292.1 DUF2922 domain-containing protein [Periweissella fabalis]NKZ23798.1 DUF2922 domain-containing protein [Periweissella fabalis]